MTDKHLPPETSASVLLTYVDGPFAYFCERPEDAWGDDWNDAPHDCNAGVPYPERGGFWVKVAYDGDLEVSGSQFCSVPGFRTLSVEQILSGAAPWLYQPSYGHKQFPEPLMEIPAKVTLSEFGELVGQAGGSVYR